MTSIVEAKRAYYASLGIEATAVADMEAAYYEGVAAGTLAASPVATTTTAGVVEQAAFVAAAAVPFADLTAAANKVNEILTAIKAAGQMASS